MTTVRLFMKDYGIANDSFTDGCRHEMPPVMNSKSLLPQFQIDDDKFVRSHRSNAGAIRTKCAAVNT